MKEIINDGGELGKEARLSGLFREGLSEGVTPELRREGW